jgi:hypothetical protein
MEETSKNNETTQFVIGIVTCCKIQELNTKNESKGDYSLGDMMLLDIWESN